MISAFMSSIRSVLERFIPDGNERSRAKREIADLLIEAENDYIKEIVQLQLQTSGVKWIDGMKHLIRPFIALLLVGHMVYSWFAGTVIDPKEWLLLQIAVGFYFVSRGVEKVVKKIL